MSRRALAWMLVCAFAPAGCGSSPTSPSTVTLASLYRTDGSGFTSETTLTVTDNATWQGIWAQINKGASQPAQPAIDFSKEWVLVASMGTKPTLRHLPGAVEPGAGRQCRARVHRQPHGPLQHHAPDL